MFEVVDYWCHGPMQKDYLVESRTQRNIFSPLDNILTNPIKVYRIKC